MELERAAGEGTRPGSRGPRCRADSAASWCTPGAAAWSGRRHHAMELPRRGPRPQAWARAHCRKRGSAQAGTGKLADRAGPGRTAPRGRSARRRVEHRDRRRGARGRCTRGRPPRRRSLVHRLHWRGTGHLTERFWTPGPGSARAGWEERGRRAQRPRPVQGRRAHHRGGHPGQRPAVHGHQPRDRPRRGRRRAGRSPHRGILQLQGRLGLGPDSVVGPLVSQAQYARVAGYVDKGIAEGAERTTPVREVPAGLYYAPTILDRVTPAWPWPARRSSGPSSASFASTTKRTRFGW